MTWTKVWIYLGGAITLALIALGLFAWAMFSDRPRGRKRCPRCWYSMQGVAATEESARCPECGREIKCEKDLYRTRRQWKMAGVSACVFVIALFIAIQPKVQLYGYGSMTPNTLLLFILHFDDSGWAWRGLSYRMNNDLFDRRRAPDFLDPWDPGIEKSMWRWQWRWLGRIMLSRMKHVDDEDVSRDMRRRYRDLLALCRTFARDERLRREITPILLREMKDDDGWYRGRSAMMAVDYDHIEGSLARLLAFLEDDDEGARWGAMLGIRAVALRDERGVDLLIELLNHEQVNVRSGAVSGLGFVAHRIGTTPRMFEAVDAMKDDEDCDVRWNWVLAIARMKPDHGAWRWIENSMRDDDDICVRRGGVSAATIFSRPGRKPRTTVPLAVVDIAVESLNEEDRSINWNAAWVVENVARDHRQRHLLKRHIEAIEAHADHEDTSVQRSIHSALRALGRQVPAE